MANPKRKFTRSRRDSRRASSWRLALGSLSDCPQCGKARLPHHVCPFCGFYNGRLVVAKKEKKTKESPKRAE